jgi:hypothetical protein
MVALLHKDSTEGNPTATRPVPSVDSIAAIAEFQKPEDAILIAQLELEYLDNNLSLEGDIPDNVSDIGEARWKGLFTES